MTTKLLLVGIIGKAQGLDGAAFVRAFNPDSPLWRRPTVFNLLTAEQVKASGQNVDVIDAAPGRQITLNTTFVAAKGRLCARFKGVRFRDQADALRGYSLAVPIDALADPEDDEFFYHEVKGWPVVNVEGTRVGTVINVVSAHVDMLEVAPTGGGEAFFIPCVEAIVTEIDRSQTRIIIDPPEGLIP